MATRLSISRDGPPYFFSGLYVSDSRYRLLVRPRPVCPSSRPRSRLPCSRRRAGARRAPPRFSRRGTGRGERSRWTTGRLPRFPSSSCRLSQPRCCLVDFVVRLAVHVMSPLESHDCVWFFFSSRLYIEKTPMRDRKSRKPNAAQNVHTISRKKKRIVEYICFCHVSSAFTPHRDAGIG